MAGMDTRALHITTFLTAIFVAIAVVAFVAAPNTAMAQERAKPGSFLLGGHPKAAAQATAESDESATADSSASETAEQAAPTSDNQAASTEGDSPDAAVQASADGDSADDDAQASDGSDSPDAATQAPAEPVFDPANPPELTANIMGEQAIPADAMVAWFESAGQPYPADVYADAGAPTIEDFAKLCVEEANSEGVRPEVLFSQIMHETGYLQFGGQVSPDQCNFGGLGATNDGAAGATFPDVRTGLRAQVQHLKAYASTEDLVNEVVDPRFDLVSRGCAPTVYDLGGRWAVPGDTYGDALMRHMEDMYAIAYE